MGWITVETPNAIYKVILANHSITTHLPEGVDGFILESLSPKLRKMHRDVQYREAWKHEKNGVRLFHGDLDGSTNEIEVYHENAFGRTLAKTVALLATPLIAGILGAGPLFVLERKRGPFGKLGEKVVLISAHAVKFFGNEKLLDDFRDALIAKKAEEVIAPEIAQRVGRKPVLGIVYGAAHVTIINMLKSPSKRRQVLSRFSNHNYGKQPYLDRVVEMNYDKEKNRLSSRVIGEIKQPKFVALKRRMQARARLFKRRMREITRRVTRSATR